MQYRMNVLISAFGVALEWDFHGILRGLNTQLNGNWISKLLRQFWKSEACAIFSMISCAMLGGGGRGGAHGSQCTGGPGFLTGSHKPMNSVALSVTEPFLLGF